MRYTITIYQPSIIDAGFGGGITDIVDWAIENLTPACRPCNASKGSLSLAEWRAQK